MMSRWIIRKQCTPALFANTPLRNWHEKSLWQHTVVSEPVWWSSRQRGSKEKSRCGSEDLACLMYSSSPWLLLLHSCEDVFMWKKDSKLSRRSLHDTIWLRKQRYEGLDPELENSVGLRWWQIISTDLLRSIFTKQLFSLIQPIQILFFFFASVTFIQNNLNLLVLINMLYIHFQFMHLYL